MGTKIIIGCLGVSSAVLTFLATQLYRELLFAYEQTHDISGYQNLWLFHLLLNLAGYSTVLVPGFLIYKYLQRINYFDKLGAPSGEARVLRALFGPAGAGPGGPAGERLPTEAPRPEAGARREAGELALCCAGLVTAYLVWGLLQEKIMTQPYVMADGSARLFADSQLLVFLNRLLACALAALRLRVARAPLLPAPLYQCSYCALSNIVSAWCQYEALKFVSFPMQVLSKSCKVIPVMLMGRLVSGLKYELYEYLTAALISGGMALFLLASRDDYGAGSVSLAMGGALLALYMGCDSFTSSWQARLLARARLEPLHMVFAVNLCSAVLTAAALLSQLPRTAAAAPTDFFQHPQFVADVVLLSISSALGQLLIYKTIARFGAVTFTIIMTLRQAVSILLSCLVYGHHISVFGVIGVCIVFAAVFLRVYCRQRLRRRSRIP